MRVSPVCEVDRAVQVQPLAPGRHIDRATLAAWRPPSGGLGLVGRMDGVHVDDRLVRVERVAQILVRVDEPLLDRSVDLARRGLRLLPVEADAVHQLDQPGFAIFDAEPAADELPDLDGRRRQNLHRPGAKLVDLEGRQRAGSALEIEQDEFFNSAFVVGLEPDADGRIVNEKDLRHFLELHATIKQDQRVRPAGDAMLLQPIPGEQHRAGRQQAWTKKYGALAENPHTREMVYKAADKDRWVNFDASKKQNPDRSDWENSFRALVSSA